MFQKNNHVGIIGGGASGVFTVCNLIDRKIETDDLSPLHITLIEKKGVLGEGMAYRSDNNINLLNTAAGLFSEMDDNHDFCLKNQPSFLKWVRENHAAWASYCPEIKINDITKNSYLPRCLVGIYLRHILRFYTTISGKYNVVVDFVYDEAEDILEDNELNLCVVLSSKRTISFSHLVLALGGFLRKSFFEFNYLNNYIDNPWPNSDQLKKILKSKVVGIMGTKLSALDAVAILKSHDYRGKIIMASRSGFLPSVKNRHHVYKPLFLTIDTLKHLVQGSSGKIRLNDLMNLIRAEIEYASKKKIAWEKVLSIKKFSMSWFLWQIKMAKDETTLWQSVFAASGDFFVMAWRLLNDNDKTTFKNNFSFIWETYRFSMPLSIANQITDLIKNKQLIIMSDVVNSYIKNQQFQLAGFDCYQKKCLSIKADYLIDATGINYDVHAIKSILLKNLLRRNMIEANPDGGIMVDFDRLTVLNQKNMYAMGDLTKGVRLFTNSYLVCSNQAAQIAASILSDDASYSIFKMEDRLVKNNHYSKLEVYG
jgi:uncharacterized NAD(P)/FAD-binding protein YdhS